MLLPLCIAGKNLASTRHFNVNIIVIHYSSELRANEIMRKDFLAGLPLLCHTGGSDLAQADAMPPASAM